MLVWLEFLKYGGVAQDEGRVKEIKEIKALIKSKNWNSELNLRVNNGPLSLVINGVNMHPCATGY